MAAAHVWKREYNLSIFGSGELLIRLSASYETVSFTPGCSLSSELLCSCKPWCNMFSFPRWVSIGTYWIMVSKLPSALQLLWGVPLRGPTHALLISTWGLWAQAHQDCCCPEIWGPLLCVHNVVICHCSFHTQLLLRSCLEEWSSRGSACVVTSVIFMTAFSCTNFNQIPTQGLKNAPFYPLFSGHVKGCLL